MNKIYHSYNQLTDWEEYYFPFITDLVQRYLQCGPYLHCISTNISVTLMDQGPEMCIKLKNFNCKAGHKNKWDGDYVLNKFRENSTKSPKKKKTKLVGDHAANTRRKTELETPLCLSEVRKDSGKVNDRREATERNTDHRKGWLKLDF